jgi:hypothetical protein
VRSLAFGSWTQQGLAFYSGNVTYHLSVTTDGGIFLRCPHYRGACLRVRVDGADRGPIVFSPYELDLSDLAAGTHQIDITVFNTRQNTFAPLHHLARSPFARAPIPIAPPATCGATNMRCATRDCSVRRACIRPGNKQR